MIAVIDRGTIPKKVSPSTRKNEGATDKRYAFDYSKSYGQLHHLDSRSIEAKIKHYHEVIRLANTTADLCDQWAQEHHQCADFWRREAQQAALLLSLALVKKWGRENNA